MRGRRRRLGFAVAVVIAALWLTLLPIAAPAQTAVASAPARPAAIESSVLNPSVLARRPLAVLREPGQHGVVIAHRGTPLHAPENTLPAFRATLASGAQYFELDVRLSRDGVPVVMHDRTVDRTTDGSGAVAEMTMAELRALDAGSWFSEDFIGTRVPTLEEALAVAVGTNTDILIEYKGAWSTAAIETTVELIRTAALEHRVLVQSFSAKTVRRLAQAAPTLPVGWLVDTLDSTALAEAQKIGADAVNPRFATATGVARAHAAGLGVFVWTQDDRTRWEQLTAMGVDGIITNDPEALHGWMRERPRTGRG